MSDDIVDEVASDDIDDDDDEDEVVKEDEVVEDDEDVKDLGGLPEEELKELGGD